MDTLLSILKDFMFWFVFLWIIGYFIKEAWKTEQTALKGE